MSYLLERQAIQQVEEYRRRAELHAAVGMPSPRARLAATLRRLADRLEPGTERNSTGRAVTFALLDGRELTR